MSIAECDLDLKQLLTFSPLPDLIEVTLAPLEISASAETPKRRWAKGSLQAELAQVMANSPVAGFQWLGEYVEHKYAIAVLEHNLRVAKPQSACIPWDWMVIAPHNWYRVQVKHTTFARGP